MLSILRKEASKGAFAFLKKTETEKYIYLREYSKDMVIEVEKYRQKRNSADKQ